jgi:hypothetical protein
MTSDRIASLRRVVGETIEQGRVGEPKFLRCIAGAEDPREVEASLDELVSLGETWFGSAPVHRYRLGADSGVYLTEMVKWRDGQGAIVTVSTAPSGTPPLNLLLVGSRGSLYHEG